MPVQSLCVARAFVVCSAYLLRPATSRLPGGCHVHMDTAVCAAPRHHRPCAPVNAQVAALEAQLSELKEVAGQRRALQAQVEVLRPQVRAQGVQGCRVCLHGLRSLGGAACVLERRQGSRGVATQASGGARGGRRWHHDAMHTPMRGPCTALCSAVCVLPSSAEVWAVMHVRMPHPPAALRWRW